MCIAYLYATKPTTARRPQCDNSDAPRNCMTSSFAESRVRCPYKRQKHDKMKVRICSTMLFYFRSAFTQKIRPPMSKAFPHPSSSVTVVLAPRSETKQDKKEKKIASPFSVCIKNHQTWPSSYKMFFSASTFHLPASKERAMTRATVACFRNPRR